jgi:hypothetical protein
MVRRLQYTTALTTLFSYGLLFAFGQLRDFFRNLLDCLKRNNNDNVKVVVGRTRRQRSRPCRSFGCSLFSEVVGRWPDPDIAFHACRGTHRSACTTADSAFA